MIVAVASSSMRVAPVGLRNVTVKVSSGSATVSSVSEISNSVLVLPTGTVSVSSSA